MYTKCLQERFLTKGNVISASGDGAALGWEMATSETPRSPSSLLEVISQALLQLCLPCSRLVVSCLAEPLPELLFQQRLECLE